MHLTWIELLLGVLVALIYSVYEEERRGPFFPIDLWAGRSYSAEAVNAKMEISNNLCFVAGGTIVIFGDKVRAHQEVYDAAKSCAKSHQYSMVTIDEWTDEGKSQSFLLYDKDDDSFTRYDPFETASKSTQATDKILKTTFRNYKGTKDDILTMPAKIPISLLTPKQAKKLKDLEWKALQKLKRIEFEKQSEHEDVLYPPVEGAQLYHEYESLSLRQRKDLINSTRYVGKLMSRADTKKTLNYLTWQDWKIAKCLRHDWGEQCDDEMASQVANIDKIFRDAPKLNEDLTIFRGVKDFIPLEDQSYTFTTPNKPFAESFIVNELVKDRFLLKLTIPQGTPVLSYGRLSTHDVDEVILPRGGKFTIRSLTTIDEDEYIVADVLYEYNPQPKSIVDLATEQMDDINQLLGGGRRRK